MNSKLLYSVAAAVSAVVLNVAFVTPVHAQVKAALTRDVDRATAQPVNGNCDNYGNYSYNECDLYTVPAGKRLVVETVSYEVTTRSGTAIFEILFGQQAGFSSPNNPNVYYLAPVFTYEVGVNRGYSATQPLRMYLEENKVLFAGVNSAVAGSQHFKFSGYLVDK